MGGSPTERGLRSLIAEANEAHADGRLGDFDRILRLILNLIRGRKLRELSLSEDARDELAALARLANERGLSGFAEY
jgi:hypothetical protein